MDFKIWCWLVCWGSGSWVSSSRVVSAQTLILMTLWMILQINIIQININYCSQHYNQLHAMVIVYRNSLNTVRKSFQMPDWKSCRHRKMPHKYSFICTFFFVIQSCFLIMLSFSLGSATWTMSGFKCTSVSWIWLGYYCTYPSFVLANVNIFSEFIITNKPLSQFLRNRNMLG